MQMIFQSLMFIVCVPLLSALPSGGVVGSIVGVVGAATDDGTIGLFIPASI